MNRERFLKAANSFHELLGKHEALVYACFLVIGLLPFWIYRYVPSLDGPQHLYNSHVIMQLLAGSDIFREFFRINEVVVGYWTGHAGLSVFNLLFPAWLAEKLFLTAYVLGMVFSFRYLVRSIHPERNNLLIFLIFPFAFHMYLLMGYYSFSLGAIFYFWAFGYWIRHQEEFRIRQMILFGILVLLIFLSHAMVFVFFGASFLLYFLLNSLHAWSPGKTEGTGMNLRTFLSRAGKLALSVLPSLVFWGLYIRAVMGINPTITATGYYKMELFHFALRIRQLVGFNHEMESPAHKVLFVLLALLSLVVVIQYIRRRQQREGHWLDLFDSGYVWLSVALLFLVAYFFAPDRLSAGSMTHRFGLFFFLALLICLATRPMPKWIQLLSLLVVLGVLGSTRIIHSYFYNKLNEDILEIREMAEHMEDASTVYSLNASNNWVHRHFQLYAADEKDLVHLKNPQCAGQFPVKWNLASLPECYAGDQWVKPDRAQDIRGKGHRQLQIDYITVFYQKEFWEAEDNQKWQEILEEHYELVMLTSRELGALYRRKY